jgi:hypothetical protein
LEKTRRKKLRRPKIKKIREKGLENGTLIRISGKTGNKFAKTNLAERTNRNRNYKKRRRRAIRGRRAKRRCSGDSSIVELYI